MVWPGIFSNEQGIDGAGRSLVSESGSQSDHQEENHRAIDVRQLYMTGQIISQKILPMVKIFCRMKSEVMKVPGLILMLSWLTFPALVQAQFTFTTNSDAITITGYTGSDGPVVIPASTNGYPHHQQSEIQYFTTSPGITSVTIPDSITSIGNYAFASCISLMGVTIPDSVTSIGDEAFSSCGLTNMIIPNNIMTIGKFAFSSCSKLTSVTIGNSVTNIGQFAFYNCASLTTAYFRGNAPADGGYIFYGSPTTVCYLRGTTGWGAMFGSVPAWLWIPQPTKLAFTGGQFGFNLTGPANMVVVVQACTNLSNPVWLSVGTNTFSADGTSAFSDSSSASYPKRFYYVRLP